ncbi:MAG: haloacid dehalogenase type II [Chloroflexi bacterium]|nr:haloacid dehalogenase type II [Chloroflexota bacterium]MCI0575773.1 haloacid dehalogenase type II [Chloroflexota bacterium]MCI0643620.1 haloacid dehalogenase type II [Chloroflexota bacterium]MCI0726838.1 haloacid dehalogenase type II [Chloroflexota bacterium]
MAHTIVFDVNETLLDLKALQPRFEQVFGDTVVLSQWFAQLLQTSLVLTITNRYHDFAAVGAAALVMVAARRGVTLAPEAKQHILQGMRTLPPHDDVVPALKRLREAGFRLATLTNSPPQVVEAQLNHAGLTDFFEQRLSMDAVRRFKPAPEAYSAAAAALGIHVEAMRLVAAHNWDVTGALHAGCKAAFVARPGMVLGELDLQPDIVGDDMQAVVEQILLLDRPGAH